MVVKLIVYGGLFLALVICFTGKRPSKRYACSPMPKGSLGKDVVAWIVGGIFFYAVILLLSMFGLLEHKMRGF